MVMKMSVKNKEIIRLENELKKLRTEHEILINSLTKLQKENEALHREKEENKFIIAMANNEMLGYNQGYSDGKNQNSNATEIIIKNRQAYMHKEEVEFYKAKIEFLKKENEELKQENKRIKYFSSNLFIDDYIPKRVIKNKIKEKQDKINKLHSASDCVIIDDLENQINVLQELLESSDINE